MCRFVLALGLVLALCSSINAQSPDPVEVNDPDVEWEPWMFAGPDDPAFSFLTEGASNNFFGTGAGASNTTGTQNSFFGASAGYNNVYGNDNSFFGASSGYSNWNGYSNSFFGAGSGRNNNYGNENSFFGRDAGYSNGAGNSNSFFGFASGHDNSANGNSFFGASSGYRNTSGFDNSFFGTASGVWNTEGWSNSFFGAGSGHDNSSGNDNSFFGQIAGNLNTTGTGNSFFGRAAGYRNTVENFNTFVGYGADLPPGVDPARRTYTNATAIGANACVSQSDSLVLGSIAGVNGGTSYVNVGIGTTAPVRQLHLAGPNAVFRMDRSTDTAAFIMVRTDSVGTPMKTFVVGTNASGVNQGEFIINDVGTAVGGVGFRRMTITNAGNVQFTGNVSAPSFTQTSSLAFKTNVRTYENALDTVNRLRGVRFDWKDTGKPAIGLIAEEVEAVLPEVVEHTGGKVSALNYATLVGVLVEAIKEQQKTIEKLERKQQELQALRQEMDRLKLLLAEK